MQRRADDEEQNTKHRGITQQGSAAEDGKEDAKHKTHNNTHKDKAKATTTFNQCR